MKFLSLEEVEKRLNNDCYVQNDIVQEMHINFVWWKGGVVTISLFLKYFRVFSDCDVTKNIGYLIKTLFKLFEVKNTEKIDIFNLINIPVRVVINKEHCIVAIGHFMNDKFIFIEDLGKCNGDNEK